MCLHAAHYVTLHEQQHVECDSVEGACSSTATNTRRQCCMSKRCMLVEDRRGG